MEDSIVACIAWVPRGAAKETPDRVALSKEEIKALMENTVADLKQAEKDQDGDEDDEDDDMDDDKDGDEDDESEWETDEEDDSKSKSSKGKKKVADTKDTTSMEEDDVDLSEFNLDDYDKDEADLNPGVGMDGKGSTGLMGLTFHTNNDEDPYIELKDDDDDEEIDDYRIRPEDNLVVVGRTEDVYSHLEVYVYDEHDEHMFVHHDIMLSAYPLCLEWLDFDPDGSSTRGNMLAVGSMTPQIEVWDLDIVDCMEPAFTLGDAKRKRKKKSRGHRSEVMALAANTSQRNVLASGSADSTVKLWDLQTQECLRTYDHHTDKVQSLNWNLSEPAVLLSGSFDHTAKVFDTRNPEAVASWTFAADVECLTWNPYKPYMFLASTEDGFVYAGDTRNPGSTLFTIHAHDTAVSVVTMSKYIPGLMVTASTDKTIKIWDIHTEKPKFVTAREMNAGSLFAAKFSPDSPGVLVFGGSENGVASLDVFDLAPVRAAFAERPVTAQPHPVQKRAKPAETEDLVYADGSDVDDDDESWIDVMKDMAITPSQSTIEKESSSKTNNNASALSSSASSSKDPSKPTKSKVTLKKKTKGKKKKK